MHRSIRHLVVGLSAAGVVAAAIGLHAEEPPREAARLAVERALPFVEREGVAWMNGEVHVQEGAACVSCHHVGYAVWAHGEAKRAGVAIPERAIAELERRAVAFLVDEGQGRAAAASQLILSRPLLDALPAAEISRLVAPLGRTQGAAGTWRARGQFPNQRRPIAETDAVTTHWLLLALAAEPTPAGDELRARSAAWMRDAERGTSTEWLVSRMLAEAELGGGDASAQGLADWWLDELLTRQNSDGGWGWSPGDPSDAFSTGQALYGLAAHPAGGRGAREAERAVAYLAERQQADGSWLTPSERTSVETSADRDVIYHFWGTAWATIGLARWLANPSTAEVVALR